MKLQRVELAVGDEVELTVPGVPRRLATPRKFVKVCDFPELHQNVTPGQRVRLVIEHLSVDEDFVLLNIDRDGAFQFASAAVFGE